MNVTSSDPSAWSVEVVLANLITSLIANAVTAVVNVVSGHDEAALARKFELIDLLNHDGRLSTLLQKGAADSARHLNKNHKQIDRVKTFFVSPEAETIARQMFATHLLHIRDARALTRLRSEFQGYLQSFLSEEDCEAAFVEPLFEMFFAGCERVLQLAVERGVLAAHEAMSAARFHVISTELASLKGMVTALNSLADRPFVAHYFEEQYRKQVADKHGWIVLPHLHAMHRVPSTSLFVPPILRERLSTEQLSVESFWGSLSRAVIIGNPGAGKSTLMEYTCHQIASRYSERLACGRLVTPVFVSLAEYALLCRRAPLSILAFIEQKATSRYQIEPPKGVIGYLLGTGRLLILFDGLDEVIDVTHRAEVVEMIEAFCHMYPSTPTVVTSREIGYDYAPLRADEFPLYRIDPFDDRRVAEFTRKWFDVTPHLDSEEVARHATAVYRETATAAPDLRTNPLMLGLICNLYRSEGYIPEHRTELFEKCAMLLYEQWDRRRDLPTFAFESQMKPILAKVAHWIYTDPPTTGGVSERQLILFIAAILEPKYKSPEFALKAAKRFVEFCRGRAWVFTDIGADSTTALYQFTHRTFLEYFTAAHAVGTRDTVEDLARDLLPYVERGEWEVIARMAFQIKARQSFEATDGLVQTVLDRIENAPQDAAWRLLRFMLGTLEALVPGRAVDASIAQTLVKTASNSLRTRRPSENVILTQLPQLILESNAHTRRAIIDETLTALEQQLADPELRRAASTLEVAAVWAAQASRAIVPSHAESDRAGFQASLRALAGRNASRSEQVWRYDRRLALISFAAELCPASILASTIGLAGMFEIHKISALDGELTQVPFITLYRALSEGADQAWLREGLSGVGQLFTRTEMPWVRPLASQEIRFLSDVSSARRPSNFQSSLNSAELFGAFCVSAIIAEWIVDNLKKPSIPITVPEELTVLISARFNAERRWQDALTALDFTDDQRVIARRWVGRERNCVGDLPIAYPKPKPKRKRGR